MQKSVFLRGASRDNQEAEKILIANNVTFVEVYSESKFHEPILYTDDSAYAYKGLAQIREYVDSIEMEK